MATTLTTFCSFNPVQNMVESLHLKHRHGMGVNVEKHLVRLCSGPNQEMFG
jgi:hypothetical protein